MQKQDEQDLKLNYERLKLTEFSICSTLSGEYQKKGFSCNVNSGF